MRSYLLSTQMINKGMYSIKGVYIFAILLLTVLTVTPMFFIGTYLMVFWAIFFILTFTYINQANKELRQILFLGLAFVLICTLYCIIGVSSADLAYSMPTPFIYFAPILALVIIDRCDNEKQIKLLFHFISLAIVINIADSIRITHQLGLNEMVYQAIYDIVQEEGIKLNLGRSLFVNMVVFYSNVMFMAFLNTKKTEKILFLLYFCISAYFIIFCSLKATAILLFIVSILLQVIANRSGKNFGKVAIISVFVIGLFYVFRDSIINLLVTIIDSDRVTSRLIVFTSGGSVSDSNTLVNREALWQVSLNTWLRNPLTFIFGIGDHNWKEYSSTALSGIGDHSDLFDVLARYGIIGGAILYSSIIIYYKYLIRKFGFVFKGEILSFFILLILMGLTKKFVAGETAIVIFILLPLCLIYCYNEKQQKTK